MYPLKILSIFVFISMLSKMTAGVLLDGIEFEDEIIVKAEDLNSRDFFGFSVAVDGDVMVVGSHGDDSVVNGQQYSGTGAAYVYRYDHDNEEWTEEQKLTIDNPLDFRHFGDAVAISGHVIAIAASQDDDQGLKSGSVTLFRYDMDNESWEEEAHLSASDGSNFEFFGKQLSLDTDTLVVGSPRHDTDDGTDAGAVYVYSYDSSSGEWGSEVKLMASDGTAQDNFGSAVALDGDTLLVGARGCDDAAEDAGAVYVFELDTEGTWMELDKLDHSDIRAGDRLGSELSLEGETFVAGCPGRDVDNVNVVGEAFVFQRNSEGDWEEFQTLVNPDPEFLDFYGSSVSLQGNTIAISATYFQQVRGDVYTYRYDSAVEEWSREQNLTASDGSLNDWYGSSVSVSREKVIVGAPYADDDGAESGSVYTYSEACGGLYTFDTNGDGSFSMSDIFALLAFLYTQGEPVMGGSGDVNCDGDLNIADATFMVSVLFE